MPKKKKKKKKEVDPSKVWQIEEQRKKAMQQSSIGPDSPYYDDRDEEEAKDLKDSWQSLLATAKIKFPERYAAQYQVRPRERAAAFARVMGWSVKKISDASGFTTQTIYEWLKKPNVLEFMDAVEHYQGRKDSKELLEKEAYASIVTMKEIRDDSRAPAAVRKDIAKFFLEMKYGKAKESVEHKGFDLKTFTETLNNLKQEQEKSKPTATETDDPLYLPERDTIN